MLMSEPFMEPILRKMRIGMVTDEVRKNPNCILLDVGCGFNHKFLSSVEPYIAHGIGVDFKVATMSHGKIRTIQTTLNNILPFENDFFDIVTMLAVLEHLEKPKEIVSEIARVLKTGGLFVLTVPGKRAEPILNFLAFKLGIINKKEIADHKKYYDLSDIEEIVKDVHKLEIKKHKYFQFGMNNFCIIRKK
jgi:SAM-dependent methyltransferase